MYFVHVTHVVLKSHTAYTTEPECSEIDNFDKKKFVVIDLPDTCIQNNVSYDMYTLYFYGSPES